MVEECKEATEQAKQSAQQAKESAAKGAWLARNATLVKERAQVTEDLPTFFIGGATSGVKVGLFWWVSICYSCKSCASGGDG